MGKFARAIRAALQIWQVVLELIIAVREIQGALDRDPNIDYQTPSPYDAAVGGDSGTMETAMLETYTAMRPELDIPERDAGDGSFQRLADAPAPLASESIIPD